MSGPDLMTAPQVIPQIEGQMSDSSRTVLGSSPALGSLKHVVYGSFDEARAIRDEWDSLAEAEADLFSSFDWCAVWWKHYGRNRRLQIHVFSLVDRIVGIAPLFCESIALGPFAVRGLRIVGCDHSVTTCGLVIRRDMVDAVVASLVDNLAAHDWDLIHLGRLSGGAHYVDALTTTLTGRGSVCSVKRERDNLPQTVIDLPRRFDDYLQGLSYRERHSIRKEGRRLSAEHQIQCDDASQVEGPDRAMQEFIEFHQAQWIEKGQRGHFADWPAAREFHHELAGVEAAAGRLILRRVRVDGRLFAMAYTVRFGPCVHWLLAARSLDPRWHFCFPGRVAACDLAKAAIEQGISVVDMGLGYYPYKMKLGGRLLPLTTITAVRKSSWARLKVAMLRKEALFHELIGYRLWYSRVSVRFPQLRVAMNHRWIRLRMWPGDARDFTHRCLMLFSWPMSLLVHLRNQFSEADRGWSPVCTRHRIAGQDRSEALAVAAKAAPDARADERTAANLHVQRHQFSCELGEAELKALRHCGGKWLELAVRRRLDRGAVLWIAWLGDQPAAMCWAASLDEATGGRSRQVGKQVTTHGHVLLARRSGNQILADMPRAIAMQVDGTAAGTDRPGQLAAHQVGQAARP